VQERLVREVTVVFKRKTCRWVTNNVWELAVVNYTRETGERGYRVFKRKNLPLVTYGSWLEVTRSLLPAKTFGLKVISATLSSLTFSPFGFN
jgi:hypothetical protein